MKATLAKTVWSNRERTRHFLIPDDAVLPPGSFVLRTVVGRHQEVDEAAALVYEVSRDEAKAWLSGQMTEVFGEAKDRLLGFLRKAQQEKKTPSPEREPSNGSKTRRPPPPHTLTNALNRAVEGLPEDQRQTLEATTQALKASFKDLGAMVEGALSGDEAAMQAARDRIDALRQKVQDQNAPGSTPDAPSPNTLGDLFAASEAVVQDPGVRAQRLDEMADWVEDLGRIYARRLRERAQTLRDQTQPPAADPAT